MRARSAIWTNVRVSPLPLYLQPFLSSWGKRRLKRYRRLANGQLQHLHATRGWKFA